MRLTSISAKALKGQTFTHPLGELTMITGDNDKGKTARIDAVTLALLGFIPALGKTGPATFTLSSATKMQVEAQIEGLGNVQREWHKSGKSVKATSTLDQALPETPLVLLNAAEYFGKGDKGRVDMLFDVLQMDASEWSIEKLAAKLVTTLVDPVHYVSSAMLKAKPEETVQQWLDRVAAELAEALKAAKADVDRYTETAQGIAALAQSETPVDPDRVATDIRDATKNLEALMSDKGRLEAVVLQQRESLERRNGLQREIAEKRAEIGDRPLPDKTPSEVLEDIRKAERELQDLKSRHQHNLEAARTRQKAAKRAEELKALIDHAEAEAGRLEAAEQLLATLDAELQGLGADETAAAQAAVNRATKAKATLEEQMRGIDAQKKTAEERHERLLSSACCPTCGRPGAELREAVEEQTKATLSDLAGQAAGIETQFITANADLRSAQDWQNKALKAQKRRQVLERQRGEVQMDIQRATNAKDIVKHHREELENLGETDGTLPEPPEGIAILNALLARLGDDHRRLLTRQALGRLEGEIQGLTIPGDEEAGERLGHVEDEIDVLRARMEDLQELAQKAANQAADSKRLAEAQEARVKQEERVKILNAARKDLMEQRAALISATFGPLLERVNVFTKGILDTPLEYREDELGRFKGANWVPVRAFGGTHTAVTYAGIQAALGSRAPAKLVIVDEMGRFDATNKRKFIENVQEAMRQGLVEQFIGVDVNAADYQGIEGLTVLKVG